MNIILSASILSIDFYYLNKILNILNNSNIEYLHIDIMDGIFVPNISFGIQILSNIRKHFLKKIDIHLMIMNPEEFIKKLVNYNINSILIHYENSYHLHRTINLIKEMNIKVGVVINPHTPVSLIIDIINEIDIITIMSVNPGFSAQKFIYQTLSKIEQAKNLIIKNKSKTIIEVDGGININNIINIIKKGADKLVIGNGFFYNKETHLNINNMNDIIEKYYNNLKL